jgi:hypothetical protein
MAADNNDDCTSNSIAHVLSEVNDFIDALDREEVSVRGDDGLPGSGDANPIPRSLMIENTHALTADHRHTCGNNDIVYGDDENAIHDSEELISSLSSRYQMLNLESSVEQPQLVSAPNSNVHIDNGGEKYRMEIDANLLRDKEQLGYGIGSVRRKSSGGKIDVIDFNGVAGRAAEVKHRSVVNFGSDSPSTDILTDSSIGHSAGESTKNSVASCVENVPPSQRLLSHSTTTAPVSHLELKPPQPEGQMLQTTQLSDVQMVKNKSNSMRIEKNDNLSPPRPSAATMSSSMTRIRSPFSLGSHHLIRTNDKHISSIDDETIPFSLRNCRKVSLLLKVNPFVPENAEEDRVDDDGYGPILFPAHMGSEEEAEDNGVVTTIWTNDNAKQSQMRHGEVILVNPKAFEVEGDEANFKKGGTSEMSKDRITGRVTVDTAKLVAEVVSRNCVWY